MKRIMKVILATLLVTAVVGGYFYYQSRAATGTDTASTRAYTQIVQVKQGDLSSTLGVVGQLEAEQSASVAFEQMSGTTNLLALAVQAGNVVTAGQVLATIDTASYQQALGQAKSDLLAAEETLADLLEPATALAIAQADVAVTTAEQTLEQAKADLADLTAPDLTSLENAVKDAEDNLKLLQIESDLAERDSLAKSERDLRYTVNWYGRRIAELQAMTKRNAEETEEITTDQGILAAAQADLDRVFAQRELARQARADELAKDELALADAQQALADAQAGGDKLTLAQAQLAVHEAEVSLQAAQEARQELDEGADATTIATAQAAVDKKRLAVSDAEAALAGTQLTAPFDGTILETNFSAGDQVTADTAILTLANLKTMQVVASVDETTIRQVSEGQAATISFDAFPGQSFHGPGVGGAAAGHAPGRCDGVRRAAVADGRRGVAAAGRHDGERRDPGGAGHGRLVGADPRPPAIQQHVPGAGAQHDRSQWCCRGGAGGDWAERRHLHADHQGPQRR